VLTLRLLLEWSVLGLVGDNFLQVHDFYDLYDFLRPLFD
jgi:hypothetical protein